MTPVPRQDILWEKAPHFSVGPRRTLGPAFTGTLDGGKQASEKLEVSPGELIPVSVVVDLKAQEVP